MTQTLTSDRDTAPEKGAYSLTLGRGMEILSCFTPERPVLEVYEVATELELSRTTAHRFVSTLEQKGYIVREKTPKGARAHKYRLGLRVLDLGASAISQTPMTVHARPILHSISAATEHRVSVGVLAGPRVLIVESAAATNGGHLLPEARVGSQLPAHCTSLGKVLLAALRAAQVLKQLGTAPLASHLPNTITSRQALRRELATVREQRFAESNEELWPDISEIAVPVVSHDREALAALSITAHHSIASPASLRQCLPSLEAGAVKLSAYLGGPPPVPSAVLQPTVVAELRIALVEDLLDSQEKVSAVLDSQIERAVRSTRYRNVAEEFQARYEIQRTIGWPDDPSSAEEVTITGNAQIGLAIRCLRRRLDEQMDLDTYVALGAKDPPRRRNSVDWAAQPVQLSETHRAVAAFLHANEPASATEPRSGAGG